MNEKTFNLRSINNSRIPSLARRMFFKKDKQTPPRLDKKLKPKNRSRKLNFTLPMKKSDMLIIIGGMLISVLVLFFVIRFGRTEANIWFNGGI